jgi:transposase
LKRNFDAFGTVIAPKKKRGPSPSLTPQACDGIEDFVLEHGKQASLEEIAASVEEEYGIVVHKSQISRELARQNLTRKVVSVGLPRLS